MPKPQKAPVKAPIKEETTPTRDDPEMRPDWNRRCTNCGAVPIVPLTGLCGPCTFGEGETAGGNW
jgi:hypothetical protein